MNVTSLRLVSRISSVARCIPDERQRHGDGILVEGFTRATYHARFWTRRRSGRIYLFSTHPALPFAKIKTCQTMLPSSNGAERGFIYTCYSFKRGAALDGVGKSCGLSREVG